VSQVIGPPLDEALLADEALLVDELLALLADEVLLDEVLPALLADEVLLDEPPAPLDEEVLEERPQGVPQRSRRQLRRPWKG
jgi:hypothetical protein